jgi:hypothetical protein
MNRLKELAAKRDKELQGPTGAVTAATAAITGFEASPPAAE